MEHRIIPFKAPAAAADPEDSVAALQEILRLYARLQALLRQVRDADRDLLAALARAPEAAQLFRCAPAQAAGSDQRRRSS